MANLDAIEWSWDLFRDRQHCVEVGGLDHGKATEHFFRLSEGAIHPSLPRHYRLRAESTGSNHSRAGAPHRVGPGRWP